MQLNVPENCTLTHTYADIHTKLYLLRSNSIVVIVSVIYQSSKVFIFYEIRRVRVEAAADTRVSQNFPEHFLAVVTFSMDLTGLDE